MTMMEEEQKDAANVHEEEEEDGEEEEGSEHDDDEDDITKQMVFMATKDKNGENHHQKNWWINHNGNDNSNGQTDDGNATSTTANKNSSSNGSNGQLATIYEVFSFGEGSMTKYVGLTFGILAALVSGAVGPVMIFYFATAFEDLVADPTSEEFMDNIKDLTYAFLVMGTIAFVSLCSYSTLLETAANEMTISLKTQWYQALLRQDIAYFDIQHEDISSAATVISTNGAKYQRGIGNKLGLLFQFLATFLGGIIYAFYSSWKAAVVVLLTVPFMAVSGYALVKMTTSKTSRANASYAKAGSIVYTTVMNIRTILSLNATSYIIQQFEAATNHAYDEATNQIWLFGLAEGSMMASFLLSNIAVPLFGGWLLYDQVRDNGCDPSGSIELFLQDMDDVTVITCDPSGKDVFGAMFGIFMAAAVVPQINTTLEAFTEARAACYLALRAMSRKVEDDEEQEGRIVPRARAAGTPIDGFNDGKDGGELKKEANKTPTKKGELGEEEEEEEEVEEHYGDDEVNPKESTFSPKSNIEVVDHDGSTKSIVTAGTEEVNSLLPKYVIDSSSPRGEKLDEVVGNIQFHNVTFAYPTRREINVLSNFTLDVPAGKTVAIVGPSGSGKSTVAQLLERFYDPVGGKITLDGHDLKDLNVKWLRQHIGIVSQEPILFACSIRENIAHGLSSDTSFDRLSRMELIEQAAKNANAHEFITSFPDGYETQVGAKGTKLSGGQKQRIAIARILIKNPNILILDEATSALDSESEQTVQRAIDQILETKSLTTIVIAHRLSTIRKADVIVVLKDGKFVESGSHDELVKLKGEYYALVQAQKTTTPNGGSNKASHAGSDDEAEDGKLTSSPKGKHKKKHHKGEHKKSDHLKDSETPDDEQGRDKASSPKIKHKKKHHHHAEDKTGHPMEPAATEDAPVETPPKSKHKKHHHQADDKATDHPQDEASKKTKKSHGTKHNTDKATTNHEDEPTKPSSKKHSKPATTKLDDKHDEKPKSHKKLKKHAHDDDDGDHRKDGSGGTKKKKIPILVRFHHVHFSYPSRPNIEVLKNLNLSIRSGETLAVVGKSGHGKSTIVQLIERFYDPTSGSVEFDGVDLRNVNVQWLRGQVGLVSQEPVLFDLSIAENIRFGMESVTQDEIEAAAKDANAHEFIMNFPQGYNTQVGEGGSQVSGGQKQRICIARALLRRPKLLLLDEATSALDSESEKLVQEAFNKIMGLEHQTTLVIAHRLSTIRNADRIAVIMDGAVKEIGTYEELMAKEDGRFRQLQALQDLDAPIQDETPRSSKTKKTSSVEQSTVKEKIESLNATKRKAKEVAELEEEELKKIDKKKAQGNAVRARMLAKDDHSLFVIGGIGALLAGAIFPAWGYDFAYMLELLYKPVFPCDDDQDSCIDYWDVIADDMQELARAIALGSVGIVLSSLIGYVLLHYGFGTATERMNRRVRNAAFSSLARQEVGFFDMRSVGTFTSQFQDDAALIHSFSGEPVRSLLINISSVLVGLVLGFVYMWPFALLFLAILPFMGFGAEMEMRMYVKGEDEVGDDSLDDEHSPGGIVIESLLNVRTVAALTLEERKLEEYSQALRRENPTPVKTNFCKGSGFGTGQFFQYWGLALMIFFGAWLLHTYPNTYTFRDFIISQFSLMFSLYGLTVALEGATDRKRANLAADRIFDLTDRKSAIDPLSKEGMSKPGKADGEV